MAPNAYDNNNNHRSLTTINLPVHTVSCVYADETSDDDGGGCAELNTALTLATLVSAADGIFSHVASLAV